MKRVTEPKDTYIKVRITQKEYDALKAVVEDEGATISSVIRQGIREIIAFHR